MGDGRAKERIGGDIRYGRPEEVEIKEINKPECVKEEIGGGK